MSGLFITMEGTDGAGKSTQIELLKKYFKQQGCEVVFTREPGGTNIGEKIRNVILDNKCFEMTHITEALLYSASRAQLVKQIIKPALKKGSVVICDRFVDSSIVYQGIARGISIDIIEEINNFATGGLVPDITFFLNLDLDIAIKRKRERQKFNKKFDRMDSQSEDFYKKVHDGYLQIAQKYFDRIQVIDASLSAPQIHQIIIDKIEKFILSKSFFKE